MADRAKAVSRRPIREGLFHGPLEDFRALALAGTACASCGEVTLGASTLCLNCGAAEGLRTIALGHEGELLTWSVIRHKPPGDYRGPEPFEPYGLGLVALREGLAVVSPLRGDIASLAIGKAVHFEAHPLYVDPAGAEVIAFRFALAGEEAR